MRLSNEHPTLVVLESALGGLHGDNGAAAIGSAVGCRGDYNCISRNANACLQRLELHRRATHATLCRLQREQRWKMGRVAGLWEPRESTFHRNMAVCEGRSQRSFPCWRRRSSLRSIVRARRQSRDALCLPCSARRPCTLNTEAFIGPR